MNLITIRETNNNNKMKEEFEEFWNSFSKNFKGVEKEVAKLIFFSGYIASSQNQIDDLKNNIKQLKE